VDKKEYWDGRFTEEGKIWGDSPSKSAHDALRLFLANNIKSVLVPGFRLRQKYKIISSSGLDVVGVENLLKLHLTWRVNLTRGLNSTTALSWICPSITVNMMPSIVSMSCIFPPAGKRIISTTMRSQIERQRARLFHSFSNEERASDRATRLNLIPSKVNRPAGPLFH